MKPFRWLQCRDCGWEMEYAAAVNQCGDCGRYGTMHVHSNVDGELPQQLPQHSPSCSNQNVLDPAGAYRGAEECSCQPKPF